MSRWITLNVTTDQPEALTERLGEYTAYEPDGERTPDLVLYSFMSGASMASKEGRLRSAADVAFDTGADAVVGILAGDTADWATYWAFTTDAHGQIAAVELGHVTLDDAGHQRLQDQVVDRYGFGPDLGGNYRRDRWGHVEMYRDVAASRHRP